MNNSDNLTIAERGGIYEFFENDGTYRGKLCLVVSNNDRRSSNIVSILILSEATEKFNRDCVDIPVSSNKVLVARCGLVTYCRRKNLGCQLYKLSKHTMKHVDAQMKVELGVSNRHNGEDWFEEEPDYEKLYKELVSTLKKKSSY